MHVIDGVVQHYAWGDEHAIPDLLGIAADGRPWAELWFGTHPAGPSTIRGDGDLGEVAGPLPHLLKVLAAAQPLSLQAHPSAAQAREGHAAGRYADPFPKPELLCALTPFDALCGVRPPETTSELLRSIGATGLAGRLEADGVAGLVEAIYRGTLDPRATLEACARSDHPSAVLATNLSSRYPGDPSVVVTMLLNRVRLRPGEAIYLDAGNLHSYVGGVGIEVMTASDNVVRGGLTDKDVDVDDLLAVFDPTPLVNPVYSPVEVVQGVHRYAPDGAPFVLWRLHLDRETTYTPPGDAGALVLCTESDDADQPRGTAMYVSRGETIPLPGSSTWFALTSPAL